MKSEGKNVKEWQKGEMRHLGFSLLTEEIVELSYGTSMENADQIASTLKRCCLNANGRLRIVNIL